jgi:NAD(P)-dependent dehydrogenase (short-subunit alcohol dehydrogenase family)
VTGFDLAFDGESYPFATETLDVADAQQVARCAAACWQGIERLDVLVNAAGILRMGATDELSQEAGSRPSPSTSAGRLTCSSRRWASSVASRAGRSSPSPPMPRIRRASA